MPADLWMIEAMIQPFKLETVTLALARVPGFGGMTVSDCRGFGRGKLAADAAAAEDRSESRRSAAELGMVDFTSKIKLEIAVASREAANAVADAIARSAHTGRSGDGKIFVWPIARAMRVRTDQEDASAL